MTKKFRRFKVDTGVKVTRIAKKVIDDIWALNRLGLPQCWIFEGDDSPEAYETVESLVEYVQNFGGRVMRLDANNTVTIMDGKNTSGGRFLVQID